MNTSKFCARCGTTLPEDGKVREYCPGCLLRLSLESTPSEAGTAVMQRKQAAPAPETLAPHFPRLDIRDSLGQGGMGWVYKAHQTDLDRTVAVKVLPGEFEGDPSFRERFRREARALARLDHGNVVHVHDTGEAGGFVFLVMEYVDGLNLRQIMQEGPVPPRDALDLVGQICDALEYAHDQGVVHRDVKPENVLVDRSGKVKIADFGLARLLGAWGGDPMLTASNQVVGTPHYMAPEQWERPRHVDHRADLYALGVMLYELLTGELPLGRFAIPSERARIDPRLDAIVLRALEKDPARRYQHAGELKDDLMTLASSGLQIPDAPSRRTPAPVRTPVPGPSSHTTMVEAPTGRFDPWLALHWAGAVIALILPVTAGVRPTILWVCLSIGGILPAVGLIRHLGTPRSMSYLAILLAWWLSALLAIGVVPDVAYQLEYCLYGDPLKPWPYTAAHMSGMSEYSVRNLREVCLAIFGVLMGGSLLVAILVRLRPFGRVLNKVREFEGRDAK